VLSANSPKELHSAKISHDTDTALILNSPKWALYIEDGDTFVKNITCDNILISNSFTIQTAVVFGGDMRVGGNTQLDGEVVVGKSLRVDNTTFFVNSTSNKVGVNTITPNAELTVIGDISGTGKINVSNGVYSGPGFFYNPPLTYFYTNAYTKIDNSLDVLTNISLSGSLIANSDASIEKDLTVKGSTTIAGNILHASSTIGRVGIGTINPSANLHVVGNALVSQNLTVNNTVGIGVSTPNKQLTVSGEISATRHLSIGQRSFYVNTDWNYVGVNVDIPTIPWPALPANIFVVNGTLSASGNTFIDGNASIKGNVGINTPTPNRALTVTGDVSATGTMFANSFSLQTLDVRPVNLTLTSQLSTFTTPVTATGDFLLLNVNGTTRAIRLWNF
jgi:hypothetical protein